MSNRIIGLVGNPNCGKTTLFNRLTGAKQVTGNWPGVTVKRKEATVRGRPWTLVDLPGIYALASYAPEETVARDFLQTAQPDLILNIADATALERNLYLTVQLLEQGRPMVLALNLCDELQRNGGQIDCPALSRRLGIPVVPISARSGKNVGKLLGVLDQAMTLPPHQEGLAVLANAPAQTEQERYDRIRTILQGIYDSGGASGRTTEKIDDVLTHPVLAIPIFLLVMLLLFTVIFGPPGMGMKALAEQLVGQVSQWLDAALEQAGASWWAKQLAVDGIWGGVGGMLTFLPQMALLFLFLSLMEDSGYMARGAFVMDRLFRRLGLSGKAFIPLFMGFGCTTPAAMAARTLERAGERRRTLRLLPFFSCGAKLPVYILFASAFFPEGQSLVIFGLYLLGVLVGIVWVCLVEKSSARGADPAFVMELPPYRWPTLSGTLRHLWDKCKGFLAKAGTVIVFLSALIWLLQHLTPSLDWTKQSSISLFGCIGEWMAPLFGPLGFGSWQASVSLLAGIVAKEAVVSSMVSLYACGRPHEIAGALQGAFSPAAAVSFLVFVLLYPPCVAAMATIRRELGSWRETGWMMAGQIVAAYTVSFLAYRIALLVWPA